ncbi:MAG: DUF262 domain-containing protein [Fibromonadaceae bacterium]|jgi:hypothetical protein|nr:DUF262 domain-containing protein [Fibromonadaceae bacterium]
MEIKLHEILVEEVVKNYVNNDEEGVVGFDGKLNIRPKYQREFVYKDDKRNAVLETIRKKFPLNVMYWAKNEDGTFEVLDGQQRTISICEYIIGNFSMEFEKGRPQYFHTLEKDEQEQILNYKLMIYHCEGTDREKLDWFKIINIAGVKLTGQELRNAIYTGEWLTDAKRYFSKSNCPAYNIAKDYLTGVAIRQEYLETAIKWISEDNIEQYMADNQHAPNSNDLWLYFQNVMNWVKVLFPNYRKEMKGVNWGDLYNNFKDRKFDANILEKEIKKLMIDDDVTSKKGIYEYLINGQEKHLSIRSFSEKIKIETYEKQKGICSKCEKEFKIEDMEADHITPWSLGGKTIAENCQMLCKDCNRRKSGK